MKKYDPRKDNDYLKLEKKEWDYLKANAIYINRISYNITEEELQQFYKEDYYKYRIGVSKKGQPYKIKVNGEFKEKNIVNLPLNKHNSIKKDKVIFDDEKVKEQIKLFNKIFNIDDDVFVRLLCKKSGEYYSYPINALKDFDKLKSILNSHRFSAEDLMYTFNTYNNLKSATEQDLHLITAIAIDVDFGEIRKFINKKPLEIINLLEKTEFNKTIPTPQIVEYGHNLRLIYVLEKVPATIASKALANKLATTIGSRLEDFGGSKQPLTTFGRVIGSINSKDQSEIKVMYFNTNNYKLKDLQEKWLEPLPEWYAEWKTKTGRKVIRFNKNFKDQASFYVYNKNRITDFYKIQEFYSDDDCAGFRRFLCFQVRNHAILAGYDESEAEKILKDFNNNFKKPLKWREIERDTRNVERKQYTYKSKTILNYIGSTPDEEILMHLSAILSDEEYKRRNNVRTKAYQKAKYRDTEGLTKTERKRLEEFIQIAELEMQGMSYNEISKELGFKTHTAITKKINKQYEKINYKEIFQEVQQGKYINVRGIG